MLQHTLRAAPAPSPPATKVPPPSSVLFVFPPRHPLPLSFAYLFSFPTLTPKHRSWYLAHKPKPSSNAIFYSSFTRTFTHPHIQFVLISFENSTMKRHRLSASFPGPPWVTAVLWHSVIVTTLFQFTGALSSNGTITSMCA